MVHSNVETFGRTIHYSYRQRGIPLHYNNKLPEVKAKKSDIQQWLTEKCIYFSSIETVSELRERVKAATPR